MRLRHEVWEDAESNSVGVCIATRSADEFRALIAPRSTLLHVIHAASTDEAMIAYYAWQGWGPWNPMAGYADIPYSEAWLKEQGLSDLVRADEDA